MIRIFFPFKFQHFNLSQYWWHRLTVVVLFVCVFGSGIYVWRSLNQSDSEGNFACHEANLNAYMQTSVPISQTALDKQKEGAQRCEDKFPVHSEWNFIAGVIVGIITFYLLQLVYFKVFLYIVFGNRPKNS